MENPIKIREKLAIKMLKMGKNVKNIMATTGLSYYWLTLKAREVK